jgi:hypothetical protein
MSGPDLVLLERSLDSAEYMDLIASTDLMLLPDRPDAYGPCSSGIPAEARAMGIPSHRAPRKLDGGSSRSIPWRPVRPPRGLRPP